MLEQVPSEGRAWYLDVPEAANECDVVRYKIRAFLASGEVKVGEFQRAIWC